MSIGTRISDMETLATLPASNAVVPVVEGGENKKFDLAAKVTALDAADAARPTSASLAATTGAAQIGHKQDDASAVAVTAADKLEQLQAASDYGATDAASTATIITAAQTAIIEAKTKSKWNVLGPERIDATLFGVSPSNAPARNSTLLQAAVNASYGKELIIPNFGDGVGADIEFDTTLAISPIYNGANRPISIRGAGHDADGGFSGTRLKFTGTSGYAIEIVNPTEGTGSPVSADTQITLSGFGLYGNGLNQDGAGGIKVVRANGGFVMERLWIQAFNETGVFFQHCYGAKFADSIVARNRKDGISVTDRCNNILLDNVKAPGNANIPGLYANIRFSVGSGFANLGPTLRNCDWSYAGVVPFKLVQRSDNTLTNIVVAANVATVTAANHGYLVGDRIAVRGATVDTDLDSPFGYAIATVPNANTFTFATANVANGTYTEATLAIFPYSYGLLVSAAESLSIMNYYCERCSGPNAYFGGTSSSLFVANGYNQDGWMFVEGITDARFGPIFHQNPDGYRGGAYLSLTGEHDVSLSGADTFTGGAQAILPDPYMIDGVYFGTAAPTVGTWTRGRVVYNTAPSAGGPPGWMCVTAGTPGTWKAMASLAA